jgi:lysozyme family protein
MSWGSFALGFFTGLCVGEVTLAAVLAAVRKDRPVTTSPPFFAENEAGASITAENDADVAVTSVPA